MNRRSFLGCLVGTVATAPFFAKLMTDPWQRTILPYRMLFKDDISGHTVQAPGIVSVEKLDNGFKFKSEPLKLIETMSLSKMTLLTASGIVIGEKNHESIYVCPGDTYNAMYTINVEGRKVENLEEFDDCVKYYKSIGKTIS